MLHSDWILSIEGYMLHRRSFITAGLLSSIAVSNTFAAKGSALHAHVTYTGSGTVDDAHKLYVAVWDTPDFVKEGSNGTTPIALKFVTAKSAVAESIRLESGMPNQTHHRGRRSGCLAQNPGCQRRFSLTQERLLRLTPRWMTHIRSLATGRIN
jgi:hypothetical protein